MFKTPILMLKMTFFWLLFRGKFEQKTQKSISFKNQWRLKNIKKAMVVKNIIAEDMPFTKSIFEQFWRSYCKKTIFVVFHFLKFLPISKLLTFSFYKYQFRDVSSSWNLEAHDSCSKTVVVPLATPFMEHLICKGLLGTWSRF